MLSHSISIISDVRLMNEMSSIADRAAGIAGRASSAAGQTLTFRESISQMVDALMINGYSQTQEFEADREAMSLLYKAGYESRALPDLLRVFQRISGSQRGGFFSTHPNPGERITNVERSMFNNGNLFTQQRRTARFENRF